ncbi:hypothetical protein JX265_012403 [Neoarthrinium moseri]|uniref:Macro domain-containing protein n=1 Tax=Neoarthrinium moseri TaxID=1658444 RepID=A0A9Q0AIR6_9PEZI|nr:uncharacterized protein JN550_013670 [Neoarthrinium moseri]KAI1851515.1 hypothetical protein JX266_002977 [Neoarthrinium moseri]KAI1855048.1 hypothetical protein JX265_012403 [Neoarthrinium moseri]KAI1856730.1 hypothetical protein JN550_013670 [Neoarthrinium moseri]
MSPISAADIPSLSLLYKLRKLQPPSVAPVAGATPNHNDRIGLIKGDITTLAIDAIVNAANNSLLGGGGVDGAIHRAAGRGLIEECRTLNGCDTGDSKITNAYNLPSKKVIHTVGPIFDAIRPEKSEAKLKSCYKTSLELAARNGIKTIAFSAISTGIYGYPSLDASVAACETVKEFLDGENGSKMEKVVFVTFEEKDVRSYNMTLPRYFPPNSETSTEQKKASKAQEAEAEAKASQLPDVPTADPADQDHAQKKQKQ